MGWDNPQPIHPFSSSFDTAPKVAAATPFSYTLGNYGKDALPDITGYPGMDSMASWGKDVTAPKVPGMGNGGRVAGMGGFIKDPANMTFMEGLWGGTDINGNQYGGWGMPALQAGSALFQGYNGFQNMKTAKDSLNFQKDAFSRQFENQRTLVNNELRDRDASRLQRDPSYKSTTQFA